MARFKPGHVDFVRRVLSVLAAKYPLLYSRIAPFDIVVVDLPPSMPAATDGARILLNRKIVEKLAEKGDTRTLVLLLAHEAMHNIFQHPARAKLLALTGRLPDPVSFNIVADGKVDQYLREVAEGKGNNDIMEGLRRSTGLDGKTVTFEDLVEMLAMAGVSNPFDFAKKASVEDILDVLGRLGRLQKQQRLPRPGTASSTSRHCPACRGMQTTSGETSNTANSSNASGDSSSNGNTGNARNISTTPASSRSTARNANNAANPTGQSSINNSQSDDTQSQGGNNTSNTGKNRMRLRGWPRPGDAACNNSGGFDSSGSSSQNCSRSDTNAASDNTASASSSCKTGLGSAGGAAGSTSAAGSNATTTPGTATEPITNSHAEAGVASNTTSKSRGSISKASRTGRADTNTTGQKGEGVGDTSEFLDVEEADKLAANGEVAWRGRAAKRIRELLREAMEAAKKGDVAKALERVAEAAAEAARTAKAIERAAEDVARTVKRRMKAKGDDKRREKDVGSGKGSEDRALSELSEGLVDWRKLLRRIVDYVVGVKKVKRTWARLNKKLGDTRPGVQPIGGVRKVVAAIDVSGSISDMELREFSEAVLDAVKAARPSEAVIAWWDWGVRRVARVRGSNIARVKRELLEGSTGGGGTSIKEALELAKEEVRKARGGAKLVIVASDFYTAESPEEVTKTLEELAKDRRTMVVAVVSPDGQEPPVRKRENLIVVKLPHREPWRRAGV